MTNPLSRNNIRRLFLAVWCTVAVLLPQLAGAETKKASTKPLGTGFTKTQSTSGLGGADITTIAGGIVRGLLGLIGVIFLVLLVYAGFLWATAGGNQDRVGKAKKIIVGAIIGIVLVLSAYTIADFALVTLTRTNLVSQEEGTGENFDLGGTINDINIEECPDGDCSGLDLLSE